MPSFRTKVLRGAVALGSTLLVGAGLFAGLGPAPGIASSHREAPLTAADPQIDGTDLYAWVPSDAPNDVMLVSNWIPFENPSGGPNFYSFAPGVHYDINIDNNGDGQADIIYRWVFTNHYKNPDSFLYNNGQVTGLHDPNLLFYQTYSLREIRSGQPTEFLTQNAVVVPSDVGDSSMPQYNVLFRAGVRTSGSDTFFAGQVDDPFFLDLRVFDLLYGANFSEVGNDSLAGFNVHTTAIRVPKSELALNGNTSRNPVVGIWTTAERRSVRTQSSSGSVSFSGPFVQVSRLGNPLVNEVVVPIGLKDAFNALQPVNDAAVLGTKVGTWGQDPNDLPAVIHAVYGLQIPDCDNNPNDGNVDRTCDLFPVYLTGISGLNDPHLNQDANPAKIIPYEALRLNMSVPPCTSNCKTLGVIAGDNAGFPNGRRLTDDIVDASLRVVEGCLIPGNPNGNCQSLTLGDGVDANDVPFQTKFPYLAMPHSGSAVLGASPARHR